MITDNTFCLWLTAALEGLGNLMVHGGVERHWNHQHTTMRVANTKGSGAFISGAVRSAITNHVVALVVIARE
jgi:hypothetical protein